MGRHAELFGLGFRVSATTGNGAGPTRTAATVIAAAILFTAVTTVIVIMAIVAFAAIILPCSIAFFLSMLS